MFPNNNSEKKIGDQNITRQFLCLTCKQLQKQSDKYAKENNEQWEAKEGKQRATHIDITGGLEDGWRLPLDETIVVKGGFRHRRDVVVAVGAG